MRDASSKNRDEPVAVPTDGAGPNGIASLTVELPVALVDALVGATADRVLERVDADRLSQPTWPEWMSVDTAARYLDVSPERVRKLQSRREIPFHQEASGCRVLFRRDDLDEWMQRFRQPVRS